MSQNGKNGHTNGYSNRVGSSRKISSNLRATPDDEIHDLICAGFGPASLAIAIALHDRVDSASSNGTTPGTPKVLFLEKQNRFAWHSGMLLPSAKMQISFVKDMATLRNPRSHFTFVNYLHQHNRLVSFTNLDTFLPARIEFEDYLRWCASHFEDNGDDQGVVRYGQEVLEVQPGPVDQDQISYFTVSTRDVQTGVVSSRRTRHVVIATGGSAKLPTVFPKNHQRIIHSSQYIHQKSTILPKKDKSYRIAVVGSGQSAAEIFDDLHHSYPNATTRLLIKGSALRPSDDSPFVNEIFDPDRVGPFFNQSEQARLQIVQENKPTNYGVVRLNLLERIYETLYMQRLSHGNDQKAWPHQILPFSDIKAVRDQGCGTVALTVCQPSDSQIGEEETRELEFDAVICGTGYTRNAHEELLSPLIDYQAQASTVNGVNGIQITKLPLGWKTRRDYSVIFKEHSISEGCGVWLQGCCEASHGVSLIYSPRYGFSPVLNLRL